MTMQRRAVQTLISTAALTERERGECYRKLGALTDAEADRVHQMLAHVYEDEEDAARTVRAVLLQRGAAS